ncbi:hypothetical protein GCM10010466_44650 [Planomonospora alba]|uniref:Uncharacterized protein n=1 Tax=Planomonospora alba TaxID=161354 RepID=A0ABP6NI03_9ACTN
MPACGLLPGDAGQAGGRPVDGQHVAVAIGDHEAVREVVHVDRACGVSTPLAGVFAVHDPASSDSTADNSGFPSSYGSLGAGPAAEPARWDRADAYRHTAAAVARLRLSALP